MSEGITPYPNPAGMGYYLDSQVTAQELKFVLDSASLEITKLALNRLAFTLTLIAEDIVGAKEALTNRYFGLIIDTFKGDRWFMPRRAVTSGSTTGAKPGEMAKTTLVVTNGIGEEPGWLIYGTGIGQPYAWMQELQSLVFDALFFDPTGQDADFSGVTAYAASLSADYELKFEVRTDLIWVAIMPKAINALALHGFWYSAFDFNELTTSAFFQTCRRLPDDVIRAGFHKYPGENVSFYYNPVNPAEVDQDVITISSLF